MNGWQLKLLGFTIRPAFIFNKSTNDINNTFQHDDFDEDVYMTLPYGFKRKQKK